MDVVARFADLVARAPHEVPLDEAALMIAARVRADVDVDAALGELDALASHCAENTFRGVRHHLFAVCGFRGDDAQYDDPANSCLDLVLQRRLGIPITLTVVLMEVGRRIGVEIVGIGMPGHFLARDVDDEEGICDPFHGGRMLSTRECAALFHRLHGADRRFDAAMLAPIPPTRLLSRMLTNLEHGPLARDRVRLGRLLDLHVLLPGLEANEGLALAQVLRSVGRAPDAAAQLERIAAGAAAGDAAERLRAEARRLRAKLN
jgi:regulator of sirC expression with transglutaminase-like and TPR domain